MVYIRSLIGTALAMLMLSAPAALAWQPVRPIEFVVTSGPGGGSDHFARGARPVFSGPTPWWEQS